ncbi:hypothetical protein AMATHDRAFT_61237 [Amanita thiersii Skay4041]|uniref:Nucleolar protein 9 n=1 Tax=Amanita thiersii Skay4041 TaxID=703135 RepID=A0A2A9NPZ6_9AGAR|nr:hypothetical protein AMATHDRAFT_61237 [Amanita thiersii Skay4041]
MPRENRKRGKKHKKKPELDYNKIEIQDVPQNEESSQQPSWIRQAEYKEELNPEAPYGYVDNDVKAYFRTVDVQIRDWQENRVAQADDADIDPNEDRHMFFVAALSEMSGKEKQLATDPDCSLILERIAHSMDDFVRRVFLDSLAGSFEVLSKHRFASHVCQTMFAVVKDTASREARGIIPDVPESSEHGELRTLTQLILDICEEFLPSLGTLIMDPFASHVIRSLLVLLTPHLAAEDAAVLRSKKSFHWKAKQGSMSSVFTGDKGKGKENRSLSVPPKFRQVARRFVQTLRKDLNDNEVRALAADKVACPALKILIEMEADHGMSNDRGSLMDSVTMGVVSACLDDPSLNAVEPSDYVNTHLRDPTSSHLLEAIITHSSEHVFSVLWNSHLRGKLPRLAIHPVANFVVSRAFDRVSGIQLEEALEELQGSWNKILQATRINVMRIAIDRAAKLQACEQGVAEAVCSAFELTNEDERKHTVPCLLHLMTLKDYQAAISSIHENEANSKKAGREKVKSSRLEPASYGAQLLQSLLRLSEPHNGLVINSINSLPMEERIKLAHNSYSSRIYDVLLDSPSVPQKAKRKFVMDFIGHYHLLVDDRFGSHVVDRCWDFADTYLKEKIARSLISYDRNLIASYYGRFFVRHLQLQLLQRDSNEWKNVQTKLKKQKEQEKLDAAVAASGTAQAATKSKSNNEAPPKKQNEKAEKKEPKAQKRKREVQEAGKEEDEIDAVFNLAIGKGVKRAALHADDGGGGGVDGTKKRRRRKVDDGLQQDDELQTILGAIKDAPDLNDPSPEKKKKRKRES